MTHGYRNRDVVNKPSFESLESNSKLREYEAAGDYYIAHNAPFDIGMLKKEGLLWNQDRVIDTLQVAKHLYKENDEGGCQIKTGSHFFHFYISNPWSVSDPAFRRIRGHFYIFPQKSIPENGWRQNRAASG